MTLKKVLEAAAKYILSWTKRKSDEDRQKSLYISIQVEIINCIFKRSIMRCIKDTHYYELSTIKYHEARNLRYNLGLDLLRMAIYDDSYRWVNDKKYNLI